MFVAISDMVAQWFTNDRTADMAERVAGRSRMAVSKRVMHRLPNLGPTEARGYIRARAIAIIREETNRLIEQEGSAVAGHRAKIEEAAIDLLIHQISVQLGQPKTHTHRRRAA
jgi:hypothetical protein